MDFWLPSCFSHSSYFVNIFVNNWWAEVKAPFQQPHFVQFFIEFLWLVFSPLSALERNNVPTVMSLMMRAEPVLLDLQKKRNLQFSGFTMDWSFWTPKFVLVDSKKREGCNVRFFSIMPSNREVLAPRWALVPELPSMFYTRVWKTSFPGRFPNTHSKSLKSQDV